MIALECGEIKESAREMPNTRRDLRHDMFRSDVPKKIDTEKASMTTKTHHESGSHIGGLPHGAGTCISGLGEC